jgi:hypothetical protein
VRAIGLLLALCAVACQAHPISPPPDADASPAVIQAPDGALLPPCQAACDALDAVGCHAPFGDCVRTMAHLDGNPEGIVVSGQPITCNQVAAVRTLAEARALHFCREQ